MIGRSLWLAGVPLIGLLACSSAPTPKSLEESRSNARESSPGKAPFGKTKFDIPAPAGEAKAGTREAKQPPESKQR